jgi:hypothetical protein
MISDGIQRRPNSDSRCLRTDLGNSASAFLCATNNFDQLVVLRNLNREDIGIFSRYRDR